MTDSSSLVVVVGLGKIGLPLAVQYAQHGRRVIGCDINHEVVEMVNAGRTHMQEEPELAELLPRLVQQGLLSATIDTAGAVRQAGIVVVIVPVVVDQALQANFTAIDAATKAIGAGLCPGTLIIYETTVPVGTTSGRLARLLEDTANLKVGQDFLLAYSPERVSSRSLFRDLRRYPKVIGGVNRQSTDAAVAFYRSVLDAEMIVVQNSNDAEFVKLIETTYRDVNIALANEFARFADARGLDVMAAIAAANTQPYSHIHTPGVGVGGHCIPVYPYFLLAGLQEGNGPSVEQDILQLPRAARRINDSMAEYAVERLRASLETLSKRTVLILGVAYRADVRETAFTSAERLQDALLRSDALVYSDDPLFTADELRAMGYTPFTAEKADQIEAIILQANHHVYQFLDVTRFPKCRVVLDGRHALDAQRIVTAGMQYIAIGDGKPATMNDNQLHVSGTSLMLQEERSVCD